MKMTHAYRKSKGERWYYCKKENAENAKRAGFEVYGAKKVAQIISDEHMEVLRRRINASIRLYPGRVPASKRPEGVPEDGFNIKKKSIQCPSIMIIETNTIVPSFRLVSFLIKIKNGSTKLITRLP